MKKEIIDDIFIEDEIRHVVDDYFGTMKDSIWKPFVQKPREDDSVWRKTAAEKKAVKKCKHSIKDFDKHFHTIPSKQSKLCAKLIIQLKKNKVFPKTTYSFNCLNTSITNILSRFYMVKKNGLSESLVAKYSYNGQSYLPNERPWINQ